MRVFRPSLPPASWRTTSVRSSELAGMPAPGVRFGTYRGAALTSLAKPRKSGMRLAARPMPRALPAPYLRNWRREGMKGSRSWSDMACAPLAGLEARPGEDHLGNGAAPLGARPQRGQFAAHIVAD